MVLDHFGKPFAASVDDPTVTAVQQRTGRGEAVYITPERCLSIRLRRGQQRFNAKPLTTLANWPACGSTGWATNVCFGAVTGRAPTTRRMPTMDACARNSICWLPTTLPARQSWLTTLRPCTGANELHRNGAFVKRQKTRSNGCRHASRARRHRPSCPAHRRRNAVVARRRTGRNRSGAFSTRSSAAVWSSVTAMAGAPGMGSVRLCVIAPLNEKTARPPRPPYSGRAPTSAAETGHRILNTLRQMCKYLRRVPAAAMIDLRPAQAGERISRCRNGQRLLAARQGSIQ